MWAAMKPIVSLICKLFTIILVIILAFFNKCNQGRSQEILFGGAKYNANIFIKTTSTHIYIHICALFNYIYTLFI